MATEQRDIGTDTVILEVADRVATITLNRPEAMNTMSRDLSAGMAEALRQSQEDPPNQASSPPPTSIPRPAPQSQVADLEIEDVGEPRPRLLQPCGKPR